MTSLAYDINVERDLVEASVKEVVNTLSRSIEKLGSCEFAFTTIGNLIISKGAAKMKFLPSFLDKMDSTGGLARYLSQVRFNSAVKLFKHILHFMNKNIGLF